MPAERIELLLLVAIAVAILARRFKLPYTVGLVLAGLAIGYLPGEHFALTKDLIFSVLLPPLIFEAAIAIPWKLLRRDLLPVLLLATVGLGAAAAVVAFGLSTILGWPIGVCLTFAVLISATDPVAVIALFKENKTSERLKILVESESLLNDGTAAVAFSLAVSFAMGSGWSWQQSFVQFLTSAVGGIVLGALSAGVGMLLAGRTDDHLIETVITVAVAYGSFFAAEHLHCSGVLATLSAGLLLGNMGQIANFSDKGREHLEGFWEFAAFLANTAIFLLMGVSQTRIPMQKFAIPILIAIGLVLAGRVLSVYGISLGFARSRLKISLPAQHVLFWGGLRGALALALVLGLPDKFPMKEEVTALAYGVIAFSVIVQGLTVRPLIRAENSSTSTI